MVSCFGSGSYAANTAHVANIFANIKKSNGLIKMCWGKVLLNVAVQYLDRKSNLHSENQLNTTWISVRFIYVRFIFHKHYSIVDFWYELWTMAFWKCYILLTKRNFTDWWKKIISYLNKNLILQKANIKTDDLKKWYTNLW